MHLDPATPALFAFSLILLFIGWVSRRMRQPYVFGYLLAGVLAGPQGLALITDEKTLSQLGTVGVNLLLFFVGMEISPRRLLVRWHVPVLGTLLQILASLTFTWLLGNWAGWSPSLRILLGLVISLSSTAVVIKILQDWNELDTRTGQDVLGILLIQDVALIPMLIVVGLLGNTSLDVPRLLLQIAGGALALSLMIWITVRGRVHWPLKRLLIGEDREDREMEIFAAFTLCLGLALLTGLFGLSTALGAFIAGMLVRATRETHWVYVSLEPFRIVFMALFFVSVGMLLDIGFLLANGWTIGILVGLVFLTNTFINMTVLGLLRPNWRENLYAGALLSQIGEFSFLLATLGRQVGAVEASDYQLIISVIALTLLLSPAWINFGKYILGKANTGTGLE